MDLIIPDASKLIYLETYTRDRMNGKVTGQTRQQAAFTTNLTETCVDKDNTNTRHARQADRRTRELSTLTLCQLRRASAVMRCQSAMCRVVMPSKETASERCRRQRQWPTTPASVAALKHTSVAQRRGPVLAPSAGRQIAHVAGVAAININITQQLRHAAALQSDHHHYWRHRPWSKQSINYHYHAAPTRRSQYRQL